MAARETSLSAEKIYRLDARVVDGIVKAFVEDLAHYFVQSAEFVDYLLVDEAEFQPNHRDFMKKVIPGG